MNARTLYRMAAVLFVLFAVGHTIGFLTFKPATAAGIAVRNSMGSVNVGSGLTYGDFYKGFGLSITVTMLFYALLAWALGDLAEHPQRAVGVIAWGFFAFQLPGLALSFMYFGAPPAVLSSLVTIFLGWAAWSLSRKPNHSR